MLPGAKAFAKTYANWLGDSVKGVPPAKVVTVQPKEFSLYCLQIGQQPSLHALNAFAAKKARDEAAERSKEKLTTARRRRGRCVLPPRSAAARPRSR
jgi:hypothetical protein